MTSQPGLQCQIHTSESGAHTQQGYHVRRCDIASVKDPAGCLFHDKTFKASLWTELIPCHPQTPISLHIHTYVFEMLWSERSPWRLKWVGDCFSLTGGGLGCLSALSALSCCSLNDKKRALSGWCCVIRPDCFRPLIPPLRLLRLQIASYKCNKICAKRPSSHNHPAQSKNETTLLSLWIMMDISDNFVPLPVDPGTSRYNLSQ